MYRKPEVEVLGGATTLIQGAKVICVEMYSVAQEEIINGLSEG